MGTDIHGWIEVRNPLADNEFFLDEPDLHWFGVVDVGWLFERNYSVFGSLFGVRNRTDFAPIAAQRGLPDTPSFKVREEYQPGPGCYHSPTWVTWAELKSVDWNERALDGMAHAYRPEEDFLGLAYSLDRSDPHRCEGASWFEINDYWFDGKPTMFRTRMVTRSEALTASGQTVLAIMEVLAKQYGDNGVRLTVYFDN